MIFKEANHADHLIIQPPDRLAGKERKASSTLTREPFWLSKDKGNNYLQTTIQERSAMNSRVQRQLNLQQLADHPAMQYRVKVAGVGQTEVESKEKTLWRGRPFLSLTVRYFITSERLKIVRGILTRNVENYELIWIESIGYKQTIGKRILGIGDISVRGQNPSNPTITLRNVRRPEKVSTTLHQAWRAASVLARKPC